MAPVTSQGTAAPSAPGSSPTMGSVPNRRNATPQAAHQARASRRGGPTGARSPINAPEAGIGGEGEGRGDGAGAEGGPGSEAGGGGRCGSGAGAGVDDVDGAPDATAGGTELTGWTTSMTGDEGTMP